MLKDYIFIGKILKSSGRKGKFKIYPLTDFPERFKKLEYVYVYDEEKKDFVNENDEKKKFIIEDINFSGKYIYIIFENIIEEEKSLLTNCFICIEESKRVNLPDGWYYYYDLIGCRLQLRDKIIGYVSSVENYGADDLIVVLDEKRKKIFIPMREQFIEKIDLKQKVIFIKYIEGLIDSIYEV